MVLERVVDALVLGYFDTLAAVRAMDEYRH